MSTFTPALLILLVIIITARENENRRRILKASQRRKGQIKMDNSALTKYLGKFCIIQANGFVSGLQGTITEVSGNWITVENKKGKFTTVNCDYVSSIREK